MTFGVIIVIEKSVRVNVQSVRIDAPGVNLNVKGYNGYKKKSYRV
jgi:hypothetical protein